MKSLRLVVAAVLVGILGPSAVAYISGGLRPHSHAGSSTGGSITNLQLGGRLETLGSVTVRGPGGLSVLYGLTVGSLTVSGGGALGLDSLVLSQQGLIKGSATVQGGGGLAVSYGITAGSITAGSITANGPAPSLTATGAVFRSSVTIFGKAYISSFDTGVGGDYFGTIAANQVFIANGDSSIGGADTSNGQLVVGYTGGFGAGQGGGILFQSRYDALSMATTGRLFCGRESGSSGNISSFCKLQTRLAGGMVTGLYMDSAQKVGIGTESPSTKIEVNGNAQFGSGATKSTFSTTGELTMQRSAPISWTMLSMDGASQSSGCVVVVDVSAADDTGALIFTSTTTATTAPAIGVLLETCAPGALCRVAMSGPVMASAVTGALAGQSLVTSTTRCQGGSIASTAANISTGYWLRSEVANRAWAFLGAK